MLASRNRGNRKWQVEGKRDAMMAHLNTSKPTCLRGELPFKFVGSKSQWQLFIDAGPLIYGRNDYVGWDLIIQQV